MGPNCLGGHGSLVESLNWTGDYFVKWVRKMATEDIKAVHPKKSVTDAFLRTCDEVHKTLVWTGNCSSWYKRGKVDGRVTALFGEYPITVMAIPGISGGITHALDIPSPFIALEGEELTVICHRG
jgi:hypothetical protein